MIPWTVAELDDLARDYPADAHADVAALIAGARALLAECARVERTAPAYIQPRRVVAVLSLEESP